MANEFSIFIDIHFQFCLRRILTGHERVCPKWSEGQCFQSNCPERHMVIEKARNQIQCYWENKPNGCRKPHCVFKHMNSMPVSANTTVITAVNPNVVATALIHMQQQQQQQQQTHQTQLQTIHQQPNQVNNCLDQSLIDK